MKFTDGFWERRPGVDALYAQEAYDLADLGDGRLQITAPTKRIERRGDTLNRPVLTVTLSSPLPGVIGVRVEHFAGGADYVGFDLVGAEPGHGCVQIEPQRATLSSGELTATIERGAPWNLTFSSGGQPLTASTGKSVAYLTVDGSEHYVHQRLALDVGELVYGLGERFGPLVKNGQSVDIWNADGGTASEQAYKNVPFYLTNRGYGVLVDHPGRVSFEVGSEVVSQVQFSVPGERIDYYLIAGDPKQVLDRYTQLTGRPAQVPAWSYGLWLSTSFTTAYDEDTVTGFVAEMARRDLPLSVFHFDCFWMREFNWCDFEWDPRVFPDPEGMLARLHERDLRVSVWINPYIGQRSPLFAEAKAAGYLVRRPTGEVWQSDMWQAGMALVDFTNPDATAWFQGKLEALVAQGVDAFKTDFGERIPTAVVFADGSDPFRMHNYYTHLYNRAVTDVLRRARPDHDAVVFARSATTGGQALPVHWGGDSTSSFTSMAETLRGGLSLAMSGFAFWSHDIGGFEGEPEPAVFKRWLAFGLLSSHSRLHGNGSYRVPWSIDAESVEVTRRFAQLKNRLMPYLFAAGRQAAETGLPVLRPVQLEFPDDPAVAYLDRQYLLGSDLMVAPVFSAEGTVDFYLPDGEWTDYWTGARVAGGRWLRETHGFTSLPLYVREGAVLPIGARSDRPDYDYLSGLELHAYPGGPATKTLAVSSATFTVTTSDEGVIARSALDSGWSLRVPGGDPVNAVDGQAAARSLSIDSSTDRNGVS
ncbi:alpha-xylosidase [Cryptosporangium sp. NPDC048952]|uniref:alpha-xylosidase n=1 Tax=Cryptosporangium sp. NPDC048952 TaxID=3363961 RepID=UPI0037222C94